MSTSYDLLSRGYFPKELPPPFGTLDFANKVCGSISNLPDSFSKKSLRAHPCMHNLARSGTLRRRIAICNPVLHYNLCTAMEKDWSNLTRLANKSPFSASRPSPHNMRAIVPKGENRVLLRAQYRAITKFVLKTDIARFYHSIYTHSIPWAIHGKKYAKLNRGGGLIGNCIDQWVRNGQDGQTMGIPIGPDTSLLISEIILSAVDREVRRKQKGIRGFRFMDDYELSVSSRKNAEIALGILQEELASYELSLNAEKTFIEEIPAQLDQIWVAPIRDFVISPTPSRQATALMAFFDLAFSLSKAHKDRNVLSYAIARLRGTTVHIDNWQLFQYLLFQTILAEPGAFIPVLYQLCYYRDLGHEIDRVSLTDAMNIQIVYQAPLGHSSEVAWALWTVLTFQLRVKSPAAKALSAMTDSVVALLALDARNRGLIRSGLNTELWETYLTTDELYGDQWLLSYESGIKGWLGSGNTTSHIDADENFFFLRSSGVEFYDATRSDPSVVCKTNTTDSNEIDMATQAILQPYGEHSSDDMAFWNYEGDAISHDDSDDDF